MEPDREENQDTSAADKNEFWEGEFWAEKFERTNGELRYMLSKQVMIL